MPMEPVGRPRPRRSRDSVPRTAARTLRRALPRAVLLLTALLVLYAVRPGVVENGLRSPRVWLVALGLLAAARGLALLLRRTTGRPRLAAVASGLLVAVLGLALLAPSFRQRTLEEPFPDPAPAAAPAIPDAVATSAPSEVAPTTPPPPAATAEAGSPRRLGSGPLAGIGHRASGEAALYEVDSAAVLRFEDVDIEGTPGPYVYLVPRGTRDPDRGVLVGALEAERGSFGYALAEGIDATAAWTVLVWCRPYDTPIAAADL